MIYQGALKSSTTTTTTTRNAVVLRDHCASCLQDQKYNVRKNLRCTERFYDDHKLKNQHYIVFEIIASQSQWFLVEENTFSIKRFPE